MAWTNVQPLWGTIVAGGSSTREGAVGCQLPNLRLYIASRANVDIWSELEPLTPTSNRISLHDKDGHKKDIVHYVSSMVYSDEKMSEWREEDKELVIKRSRTGQMECMRIVPRSCHFFILLNRFLCASLQVETLRRCPASSVRHILRELPEP